MHKEELFGDTARFMQISRMLCDQGHTSLPSREKIVRLAGQDGKLRAWIRSYSHPGQFMRDLKIFFYRECRKRQKKEMVAPA